ncbi:MAG: DUF488 family protein [Firmicutes bacterium]|nr:DUF488 family protein [Bacillota bacterium]
MNPIWVARIGTVERGAVHRVLVDRLWPRGIRKTDPPWDTWLKDIAPSTTLRRWYAHDPARYAVFRQRYWDELAAMVDSPAWEMLEGFWRTGPIALMTASRDVDLSHVPILRDFLQATTARPLSDL